MDTANSVVLLPSLGLPSILRLTSILRLAAILEYSSFSIWLFITYYESSLAYTCGPPEGGTEPPFARICCSMASASFTFPMLLKENRISSIVLYSGKSFGVMDPQGDEQTAWKRSSLRSLHKDCTQQTHIKNDDETTKMQLMNNHAKYKEDFRRALDRCYADKFN